MSKDFYERPENNRIDTPDEELIETVEDWNDADLRRRVPEDDADSEFSGGDVLLGDFTAYGAGLPELEPAAETNIVSASVEVTLHKQDMQAAVFILPPENGGTDIEETDILDALKAKGITYGIHTEKIHEIAEKRLYSQLFIVAEGEPPTDGKNGKIKDFFPRERKLKFSTKSNGGIDFKTLNLIHNVEKGDVVCELTWPTEPSDGMNVFGRPVRGQRGKMPEIPQGKNIVYAKNKSVLVTACEGNLTFRNGRFHVENVYEVGGNVDNSVGNIDFSGSVYIHGDVFEGYSVTARGDITVTGIVEGATLKAGGDIILHKGMRGMKKGVLDARGNITGKFLEDSKISAGGSIQAEYIINSEVSCNKELLLMGRRGALIGGSCAVFNRIRVKSIGTVNQTPTVVTLGITPVLLEQIAHVSGELKKTSQGYEEALKNQGFLLKKKEHGTISAAQSQRLSELNIQIPVARMKISTLQKRKNELELYMQQVGKSRLEADQVFPGTVILMGDDKLVIRREESRCLFYYMDGRIKMGTF